MSGGDGIDSCTAETHNCELAPTRFLGLVRALTADLVGRTVPFECSSLPGHSGWYDDVNDRVVIADWLCPYVELDPRGAKIDQIRAAYAILILAHEAAHASGIVDEHAANCAAVDVLKPLLRRVDFPKADAVANEAKKLAVGQAPPYGGPCRG